MKHAPLMLWRAAIIVTALGLVACGDGADWKHPAPPYCPAVPSNLCPDKEVRP